MALTLLWLLGGSGPPPPSPAHVVTSLAGNLRAQAESVPLRPGQEGPHSALNFTSNLRSKSKDRPLLTAGQGLSVKHRLWSENRKGEPRTPRAHGRLCDLKVRAPPTQMPSLPALVSPGPSLHLGTFGDLHGG